MRVLSIRLSFDSFYLLILYFEEIVKLNLTFTVGRWRDTKKWCPSLTAMILHYKYELNHDVSRKRVEQVEGVLTYLTFVSGSK